jgi:hypothetical protein
MSFFPLLVILHALAAMASSAVDARSRLIPSLNHASLGGLAWHIRGITALAIALVVVALIRLGGLV